MNIDYFYLTLFPSQIISMLRDDRLQRETQKLKSDIFNVEGEEEVEVELCIEEWLSKVSIPPDIDIMPFMKDVYFFPFMFF